MDRYEQGRYRIEAGAPSWGRRPAWEQRYLKIALTVIALDLVLAVISVGLAAVTLNALSLAPFIIAMVVTVIGLNVAYRWMRSAAE